MGRPKPALVVEIPATPSDRPAAKRKSAPAPVTSASKSAKSSRQSTPGSARSRGRQTKGRTYKEAESDDDLLSDDEFEAKLAEEFAVEESPDDEATMSPEDIERTKTLELASMFWYS